MPRRILIDPTSPVAIARLAGLFGITIAAASLALADIAQSEAVRTPNAVRCARYRQTHRAPAQPAPAVTAAPTALQQEPPTVRMVEADMSKSMSNVPESMSPPSVSTMSEGMSSMSQSMSRDFPERVVSSYVSKENYELQLPASEKSAGHDQPTPTVPPKPAVPLTKRGRPRKYPHLSEHYLAPYAEDWKAAYPGSHFYGGKHADALAQAETRHGAEETRRRWQNLLASKPASVASGHMLNSAWSEFNIRVERNALVTTTGLRMSSQEYRATAGAASMRNAMIGVDPRIALRAHLARQAELQAEQVSA